MRVFVVPAVLSALLFFLAEGCFSETIKMPDVDRENGMTVNMAIQGRKSVRNYSEESLTLAEAGQILWAAGGATVDGVTGPTRSYPSAGATYSLEIYLVSGKVEGLTPGIYRYNWRDHSLEVVKKGDARTALSEAAYGQKMIQSAPATVVVAAVYERVESKYGDRGRTVYVPMDAGHLGQNVHLACESMGLGTVMVAGFVKEDAAGALEGIEGEPVYMMPVGRISK